MPKDITARKFEQGFTLIELLVVITVIAILTGSLIVSINPMSIAQRARDSKRMQDLETLAKGITLAMVDGQLSVSENTPPTCTNCTSNTGDGHVDGSGWVKFTVPTGKVGLAHYLTTLPLDPLNAGLNVYTFGSTSHSFELNTVLESPENFTKMTTDGGNSSTKYEVGTSLSVL